MWRKFLAMPGLRFATRFSIQGIKFSAQQRAATSTGDRRREIATWAERLKDPLARREFQVAAFERLAASQATEGRDLFRNGTAQAARIADQRLADAEQRYMAEYARLLASQRACKDARAELEAMHLRRETEWQEQQAEHARREAASAQREALHAGREAAWVRREIELTHLRTEADERLARIAAEAKMCLASRTMPALRLVSDVGKHLDRITELCDAPTVRRER